MPPFSIAGVIPKTASPAAADTHAQMDEESFRLFYERTARPLRGYLIRMLGDPATADDLLQESYLRLLKAKLPQDTGNDHRKNYLFRIATNLLNDRRSARPEIELPADMETAAPHFASGDVAKILAGLKPAQRELLWLAYVERFSHFEIAAMLNLKAQSIRPLLSRARHAFAQALKRGGFGESS